MWIVLFNPPVSISILGQASEPACFLQFSLFVFISLSSLLSLSETATFIIHRPSIVVQKKKALCVSSSQQLKSFLNCFPSHLTIQREWWTTPKHVVVCQLIKFLVSMRIGDWRRRANEWVRKHRQYLAFFFVPAKKTTLFGKKKPYIRFGVH